MTCIKGTILKTQQRFPSLRPRTRSVKLDSESKQVLLLYAYSSTAHDPRNLGCFVANLYYMNYWCFKMLTTYTSRSLLLLKVGLEHVVS